MPLLCAAAAEAEAEEEEEPAAAAPIDPICAGEKGRGEEDEEETPW